MIRSFIRFDGVKPIAIGNQDMPPRGGYPEVNTRRGIGNRGPPGWAIWLGVCVMTAYGFYQIGQTNIEKRQLRAEQRESRMAILPYLMVEQERELLSKINQQIDEEKEIMKNVPGWKIQESVYSKRWQPPMFR